MDYCSHVKLYHSLAEFYVGEPEIEITWESRFHIEKELVDPVGNSMINFWFLELILNFLNFKWERLV